MSGTHRGSGQAAAIRLAAALEQYEGECAELVRTWLDMELYAAVSGLVDEMRTCCQWLPALSVPWVAFLISHSELMFRLWQAGSGNSCRPEVQACARDHSVTLRKLRQSCARVCEELQCPQPATGGAASSCRPAH
jgi:hypothetical protein